jgi:myosin-18
MLEFARVCAGMQTLGFSDAEMKVIWSVLAVIYHLGTAGAVKGTVYIFCRTHVATLNTSTHY